MQASKADIIARLQQQLAPLQGHKAMLTHLSVEASAGPQATAFPNGLLSFGAVHEFMAASTEEAAASGGFIAAVLATLMRQSGYAVWISPQPVLFPPALKSFGIQPDKIIFLQLSRQKDMLWATEEALKCSSLAGVVTEIPDISFAVSRRLQLAVEDSGVMGFLLRSQPKNPGITAAVTRWNVQPLPGSQEGGLPGVGFPRWKVSLLRSRHAKPGQWQVEWKAGRFRNLVLPQTAKIITPAFGKTA